jgi:CO/xanthine dehydrogenase FAD-binding subunit
MGSVLSERAIDEAATTAATECLQDDPRSDAAYRRQITKAMVARALRDAASRIQA